MGLWKGLRRLRGVIPEGGAVKTEKQFAGKQTAFFIKRVLLSKLRHRDYAASAA